MAERTQQYDTVLTETRGEVRVLTMNRPERLNAWTPHMGNELVAAIEAANADPDIGAIVLTGAGRGFCAGADMSDTFQTRIEGTDPGGDTAHGQGGFGAGIDWVATCRSAKPLVAAVNGAAVGIGMTQILPFDSIVASAASKFGMLFIKVGLVPELASTQLLVQRVGWGMASELCLSGRLVAADEAHRIGLVDHLVEADELLDAAVDLAASVCSEPGAAAAHDQGPADDQRGRDRSHRGPAPGVGAPAPVLGDPRARRGGRRLHREAGPELPAPLLTLTRVVGRRGTRRPRGGSGARAAPRGPRAGRWCRARAPARRCAGARSGDDDAASEGGAGVAHRPESPPDASLVEHGYRWRSSAGPAATGRGAASTWGAGAMVADDPS